jgi:hypothetical protein
MPFSKAKQKIQNKAKAKANKELFLQGLPFLFPRYLDIHRNAVKCHLREGQTSPEEIDSCFITNVGWASSENCNGNAKGNVWLILSTRWLNKKMTSRVPFHELDFDITVDDMGYAYKEIDGEKVKCEFRSRF